MHTAVRSLTVRPWWSTLRIPALVAVYSAILAAALWTAFCVRFESFNSPQAIAAFRAQWAWMLSAQLALLAWFGQFSGLVRYFSVPEVYRLGLAELAAAVAFAVMRRWFYDSFPVPYGVILINALLACCGLTVFRFAYRLLHEGRRAVAAPRAGPAAQVAIVGAGHTGSCLVLELRTHPSLGMKPVVLFDDDSQKWGTYVHGVPVIGAPEELLRWAEKLRLHKLIVAMPSAPARRLSQILGLARRTGLACVRVPTLEQLATGKVSVSTLRPVSLEELLGREPVRLEHASIAEMLRGQVVMVTGAGGSIGAELCRQIAACAPRCLLLVEQCESQLFLIEQELIQRGHGSMLVPCVADILDPGRLSGIFGQWQPAIVFHAAAHKHVPMMECQPMEAIHNNAIGTARLAELARTCGVSRFVMISTDKAVNPTSVMGASKRLAELYLQALSADRPGRTRFMCVRFGNVLGSSGSVVPIFTRQIAEGGPVTVTHPDMVRYFMTIPEAVGLVLQSAAQGAGGEIFVLDMGKPVRIASLARQMIELSGFRPGIDIEIRYTGLRPGEKLFEEIQCHGENYLPTRHPRVLCFVGCPGPLAEFRRRFTALEGDLYGLAPDDLKQRVRELVPEYHPYVAPGSAGEADRGEKDRRLALPPRTDAREETWPARAAVRATVPSEAHVPPATPELVPGC